jgi:hypothetical protein
MEIALVVVSVLAVYFFIRGFKVSLKNIELQKQLQEQYEKMDLERDDVKESFLKFISDSREWAFNYIEEVQEGLNKFVKDAGPSIDYFDEYGDVMETPLTPSMKEISKAYKELKKLLPEDEDAKV